MRDHRLARIRGPRSDPCRVVGELNFTRPFATERARTVRSSIRPPPLRGLRLLCKTRKRERALGLPFSSFACSLFFGRNLSSDSEIQRHFRLSLGFRVKSCSPSTSTYIVNLISSCPLFLSVNGTAVGRRVLRAACVLVQDSEEKFNYLERLLRCAAPFPRPARPLSSPLLLVLVLLSAKSFLLIFPPRSPLAFVPSPLSLCIPLPCFALRPKVDIILVTCPKDPPTFLPQTLLIDSSKPNFQNIFRAYIHTVHAVNETKVAAL